MSIRAILFDLDGTLLPMDNDEFTEVYLRLLAKTAMQWDYEPKQLIDGLWKGTAAMIKNDGSRSNSEAFWTTFDAYLHRQASADMKKFDTFYVNEFHGAKAVTGENPLAAEAVALARKKAQYVVLATNPLFPPCAVETRLGWIDLSYSGFDLVTNYENSRYCKPNPAYYMEILDKIGVKAEDCLMIGNDVGEDIVPARQLGMSTYLVTDCLINRREEKTDGPGGSFLELVDYLNRIK